LSPAHLDCQKRTLIFHIPQRMGLYICTTQCTPFIGRNRVLGGRLRFERQLVVSAIRYTPHEPPCSGSARLLLRWQTGYCKQLSLGWQAEHSLAGDVQDRPL